MKKYLVKILIKLGRSSRIGRFFIHELRTKYPILWKKIKAFLALQNIVANEQLTNYRDDKYFDILRNYKSSNMLVEDFKPKYFFIYTTPTNESLHNIHNFALALANEFKSLQKLPVFLISQPNELSWPKSGDIWKISANHSLSTKAISLFHLGNNPNSAWILDSLLKDDISYKVVILHDIWLWDLCGHYGHIIGIPNLQQRIVFDYLGIRGLQKIHHATIFQNESDMLIISEAILNYILQNADIVMLHMADSDWHQVACKATDAKIIGSPLPNYYVPSRFELQPKDFKQPKVIISGHNSPFKNTMGSIKVLCSILQSDELATGIIAGEIATHAETIMRELQIPTSLKKRISIHSGFLDQDLWNDLHINANIGIRLGAGKTGENSGVIRDYLLFGLKIITDDSQFMAANPQQVFFIENEKHFDPLKFRSWLLVNSQEFDFSNNLSSYAQIILKEIPKW